MKTCPHCGEEIQDSAKICRFCDRPVENVKLASEEEIANRKKRTTTTAIIIGAIILCIILVSVFSKILGLFNVDEIVQKTLTAVSSEIVIAKEIQEPTKEIESTATKTKTISPTPKPTSTARPSSSPTEISINTPSHSLEELEQILTDGVEAILMTLGSDDVDEINLIRMQGKVLEIELITNWASKDSQPNVSYNVIKLLTSFAEAWENPENQFVSIYPDGFDINLTTYSIMGSYKYNSFTTFETLKKVSNKSISYDEWAEISSAEFK